jgi:hypothetical protein
MVLTETPFLKLLKPEIDGSENDWGEILNADLSKIDDGVNTANTIATAALARNVESVESARTAAALLFYADAVNNAGPPVSPNERPGVLMSQKWVKDLANLLVPIGSIMLWTQHLPLPPGWALCDNHDPIAGELIRTPNLVGQFVIGALPGHATIAPGMTGGGYTHQHNLSINGTELTVSQMPNHVHGTNAAGFDTVVGRHNPGGTIVLQTGGSNSGYQVVAITSAGGTYEGSNGAPHNHTGIATDGGNLPPFVALCYIMKVKLA